MKISHSVLLGFATILLLFSVTTVINFRLYKAVNENADYVSRSTIITKNSSRFQRNILTMVNGLRGYLLTGERSFIESYDAANVENDSLLKELQPLLTDSSQRQELDTIISLNNKWTDEFTEPLREAKMLSNISTARLDSFKRIYQEKYVLGAENKIQRILQQKFKNFTNAEYELREVKKAKLATSVERTRILSVVFTTVSVIIALVVAALLVRTISRRIKVMSQMANTIAAGNYDAHVENIGNDELSSLGHSLNHMANELSKNISLLRQSNAELDQFAHVVSHDMKGPLRGISNVISWIEEDHSEELSLKMTEYLSLIKGRVSRAENLIDGLLAYARADREAVEKEPVDVNLLIQEVLEHHTADRSKVSVSVSEMPIVYTERVLLFQVFANLIGNAFKHNDKTTGKISIYYQPHEMFHEFFIEDNGSGIEEKYHERIFHIFQTLKDRDSFESAGVGLAIVKKILDRKKHTITINSKPGAGAIFSFTWPKE